MKQLEHEWKWNGRNIGRSEIETRRRSESSVTSQIKDELNNYLRGLEIDNSKNATDIRRTERGYVVHYVVLDGL